ncbi:DUF1648 domain-containing protein [Chryseobacterium sp. JK1]|uniref:DUF1648 domain-containing protein n=1 Tax=Chryseobacterium sp. JK1 TaxID=874294 RepID=UPI003D686FD6
MKTSGILFIVNALLLVVIWSFTLMKYAGLPDVIPTHFDFNGKIDGQAGKDSIWTLPCIATFISFLFFAISKNPQSSLLNVPDSFRKKEKIGLYIFSLQLPVMILFLDIIIESIRIAESKQTELSNVVFYILGIMFAIVGIGLVTSIREGITKKSDH